MLFLAWSKFLFCEGKLPEPVQNYHPLMAGSTPTSEKELFLAEYELVRGPGISSYLRKGLFRAGCELVPLRKFVGQGRSWWQKAGSARTSKKVMGQGMSSLRWSAQELMQKVCAEFVQEVAGAICAGSSSTHGAGYDAVLEGRISSYLKKRKITGQGTKLVPGGQNWLVPQKGEFRQGTGWSQETGSTRTTKKSF